VNEHLVFGFSASMVSIEPDLPGFEKEKKITGVVELGGRFGSGNVIDCVRCSYWGSDLVRGFGWVVVIWML